MVAGQAGSQHPASDVSARSQTSKELSESCGPEVVAQILCMLQLQSGLFLNKSITCTALSGLAAMLGSPDKAPR